MDFTQIFEDKLFKSSPIVPNGENETQEKNTSDSQDKRWTVLRSVFRRSFTDRSPSDLASELRTPTPSLYLELRKYLKDPNWARSFVKENGVETLLETLKSLQGRNFEEVQLKVECGQCLRLVMDSRVGLDYIMENADYTQKLATALDTDDIPVKKQVFELLSALCVYRPDGYTRALETLEHYKTLKKHRYRFQLVVEEMKSSEVVEYTIALVAFVNCLIISPASLNDRIRIRNEFLGLKILEVLNRFRKQCKDGPNSDLAVQLDVFDEQRQTDEGQFSGPDGVDLSSHMDVFFAILRQVAETPQEIPFLSILQHLLRTDLNQPLSEIIWETVETLVHRATLLESKQEADRLLRASNLGGLRCHCSCHYRQSVQTTEDCESTPGKKNRPNQLSFCSSDGMRTPTTLLSPNHHYPPPTPCDLSSSPFSPCNKHEGFRPQWKGPLSKQHSVPSPNLSKQSSVENQEVLHKTDSLNNHCHKLDLANQSLKSHPNNSHLETKHITSTQCDKTISSSVVIPANDNSNSSHGICDSVSNVNCDSAVSDDCSNNLKNPSNVPVIPPPPPPPPPPPMKGGFPPPPPPPPPPPTSLRVPPPEVRKIAVDMTLPQQDTPKPKAKMKSFNWSKIPMSKVVGKDNLWSRVAKDHTGSPNDLDFDIMERLFCQQPASNGHISPKFGDSTDGNDKKKKEVQEVNLLDGKRSLNINIFLKQFRSSHESIVRILEDGAHQDLGAERLRGLLKILPEADEVELLKNFDGEKTKLGNAEKFLLQLLEVPSYKLRVESMLLKEEFLANQEFLENSIETIRCAAQELEECRKLHEVLYMVLVAGNFLNAGGYAGNAAGFKMLSLLKLTDIRANKPSMTLIHYVAEQVLKKRPDLLEFPEEIQNLEEASKISMETLKTDVSSLCQRVSKVSTQVAVAEDQIRSQMQDFIEFAESKVETIQNEINDLESVRQRLADFLCEDTSAFKLEDCFKVFHNFCTRFKAALQENERRQKQEKLAEARRKQREQQIALKRRSLELTDTRSSADADHIMDQLLGDIRSGFPERRLGDVFRRSRRGFDVDDSLNNGTDEKKKIQNALKRHSDPAMLEKCGDNNYLDEKFGNFKNRRARYMDETNGEDIIGFLQNAGSSEIETKDRRSFGSVEDSLERVSVRRSGRRKRVEHLNGDTQSRERTGSSPPPVIAAVEVPETEMDSKQRLRAKINDWMLQNEKEQKRDRDLQLKLLQERKKRLSNGQLINGDATNIEKNILEEIEEIDPKQTILDQNYNGSLRTKDYPSDENGTFRITKSAQSRHNESFTQKIIGLINATSKESTPFAKTRLYSSTRESSRAKAELEEKSKDDSGISDVYKRQFSSPENQSDQSSSPYSDQDSKEAPKKLESNFDRFAASRKTQRRLKLREMRIEAENIKTVKQEQKTSPDQESVSTLSPTTPVTDECISSLCESPSPQINTFCTESQNETIQKNQVTDNENMKCANVNGVNSESNKINESSAKVTETNKEGGTFNRQKNTSLRSRQSRLARRINSLSATVTSPEIVETNTLTVKPEKLLDDSVKSKPETKSLVNGEEASGTGVSFSQEKKETTKNTSNEELNESKQKSEIGSTPTTSKNNGNPPKSNNTKSNANETLKSNGHISHKVTVSTETKSKVLLPKSNSNYQNSRTIPSSSKSRVPSQKTTTNIPSVIKTTQNVKVQQTIHRPLQINNRTVAQKAEVNGKRISPNQSKTINAKLTSSMPKEVQSNLKEPRINNLTNGETKSLKNGKGSPASSVSSLCSLNMNVKLIKNDKAINNKSSDRMSTKKITINHNGSVKFMKGNVSSNNKVTQKPPSTLNSTSKNEKNNTFRKKAFV